MNQIRQIIVGFLIIYLVNDVTSKWKMPDYGPYNVNIVSVELSKGLMKNNISDVTIITWVDEAGDFMVGANLTVFRNSGPLKNRMKYYKNNADRFELIFTGKSDNFCEITKLQNILKTVGKYDNHCGLLKGSKSFIVNGTDVVYAIVGLTFFYGKYKVYYSGHTDIGNLFAFTAILEILRKPNSTVQG